MGLIGLISGLKEPDLGQSGLGGGTYGRTDVRTDGRTDVRKFTPVSYRTSALWGRCPKRRGRRKRKRKRRRRKRRRRLFKP